MKKIILSIVVLLSAFAVNGQKLTVDSFCNKYSDTEGYTVIELAGSVIKVMKGAVLSQNAIYNSISKADKDKIDKLIDNIESVKIVMEEESTSGFIKDMKSLADKDYKTLLSVREEGTDIALLEKSEGKVNNFILMICEGGDDDDESDSENMFVHVTGKNMNMDDIAGLFDSVSKKKKK